MSGRCGLIIVVKGEMLWRGMICMDELPQVARALQGIVSAEELPVPSNLSKRQLKHLRSRSTSQGNLIEAVHTASPATIARFQRASSIAVWLPRLPWARAPVLTMENHWPSRATRIRRWGR